MIRLGVADGMTRENRSTLTIILLWLYHRAARVSRDTMELSAWTSERTIYRTV